ncbi:hypothetical protein DXX93_02240 [Thalassotalea euphylliae]|uniref:DUF3300 domain-containing protein n=1 Tax=Thalassotalea euphylliae TaxID=1655234 RepID=A0A3E0TM64_9GAMM|nr:hypothetical protein [Thalassotalea euphylliae]REL25483.1 hypothetical protein DXX93_02240 [Thalassotalea euphylliae]
MMRVIGKVILLIALCWSFNGIAGDHQLSEHQLTKPQLLASNTQTSRFSQAEQQQVITALSQLIKQHYPDKVIANELVLALKGLSWQPSYRMPNSRDELVDLLRHTLTSVSQDSFLNLGLEAKQSLVRLTSSQAERVTKAQSRALNN